MTQMRIGSPAVAPNMVGGRLMVVPDDVKEGAHRGSGG